MGAGNRGFMKAKENAKTIEELYEALVYFEETVLADIAGSISQLNSDLQALTARVEALEGE